MNKYLRRGFFTAAQPPAGLQHAFQPFFKGKNGLSAFMSKRKQL